MRLAACSNLFPWPWSLPQLDFVVRRCRITGHGDNAVCGRLAGDQVEDLDLVAHRRLVRDLIGQADQQHIANLDVYVVDAPAFV